MPNATIGPDMTCADELLQVYNAALVDDQESASVTVGWSETQGNISIMLASPEVESPSRAKEVPRDTTSSLAAPLELTPQLLWVALDTLALELPAVCSTPEIITLSISVSTPTGVNRYVVQVQGRYLQAWRRGTIDDETFASLARYRGTGPSAIEP
ncbi:MAG: hypothetical protein ACP5JG_08165 [Anaerolineae bacterium]